jgi:ABC-type transport system substrate-binding protein
MFLPFTLVSFAALTCINLGMGAGRSKPTATQSGLVAWILPLRGGTLVVHLPSEQRTLNPALRASTGVYNISGKIMEPLIDKSYDGSEPVLATEWSDSDDGPSVTLKLRSGTTGKHSPAMMSCFLQWKCGTRF